MKLRLVACGVLQPELERLAAASPHEVHLTLLEAGLHDRPDLLREQLQAVIDAADSGGYDALVIGYGLCGRGAAGLVARQVPVVIPRAHDCLTLFMGSREAYRTQFARHPGTFYITPGWFEHRVRPLGHQRELHNRGSDNPTADPRYPAWAEQFGHEQALYLISFHDSWKRNYTRAAYINTGLTEGEKYQQYGREMAAALGWCFEQLSGNPHLLHKLVAGPWDDSEFIILKPGQRSATSGDEAVFTAIEREPAAPPPGQSTVSSAASSSSLSPALTNSVRTPTAVPDSWSGPDARLVNKAKGADRTGCAESSSSTVPPESEACPPPPAACSPSVTEAIATPPGETLLGLGIDAGGTYTDCVLYDLTSETLIAKAKALTTHHHLHQGIMDSLQQLSIPDPAAVRLVALATTLATNSIVEDKGGQPGAIIMSPLPVATGEINWQPLRQVTGAMDISGDILTEPNPDEIRQTVRELLSEGVDAFAVSGYASVRNPAHELAVAEIIAAECDLPIICGHELSLQLDYIARANTAILNARLLGVIRELLAALKVSLTEIGVQAPLMVVKGDGSLLNETTALQRPVETILSGPAASVSGARHLTAVDEGLVFDMGGTTTDSVIISQGLARIHADGATVGGWRTSVEAADIATIGLGGDSHLNFNSDRELLVGPRRVLPLCSLAAEFPSVARELRQIDPDRLTSHRNAGPLDFYRAGRDHTNTVLPPRETAIVQALQAGPLSRRDLAQQIGLTEPSLLQTTLLENLGFVQRAALTPTDLLHVTGDFNLWDTAAATRALNLFATLYGVPPDEVITRVRETIIRRLCGEVLRHLTGRSPDLVEDGPGAALLQMALQPETHGLLQVSLAYHGTLIALGAPVKPYFPEVARRLNTRLIIPPHAEVANAIGAIAAEVVVRERVTIRPGELSAYVVHSRNGKREYNEFEQALQAARTDVQQLARDRAQRFGAADPGLRMDEKHRQGLLADGQRELIEVVIEAIAAGRPDLKAAT